VPNQDRITLPIYKSYKRKAKTLQTVAAQ